ANRFPPAPGWDGGATTPTATATPTPLPGTDTSTPTATATTTPAPLPPISLNEVLPAPFAIDWNGDGTADQNDEWIELYNAGASPVNLEGWQLDDLANGGTAPYTIPAGRLLGPGEFAIFFRSETGVALNNTGSEQVRLLAPGGIQVEDYWFANPDVDWSYSKVVDGGTVWTDAYPPSPGASNQPPTSTPTATATLTPTIGPTPTLTPTPTPNPSWQAVRLNEFLAAPENVDWNGDGILDEDDEYVELLNTGDIPVDVGGWQFDDIANGGSTPYTFAAGTLLPAHGFRVFFRSETGVALNNTGGDDVRLLAPDGQQTQIFHFTTAGDDQAWSALPDGSDTWVDSVPPSPGASNQPTLDPVTVSGAVYRGQPGDTTQPLGGVTVQLWAGAHVNAWDRWLLNGLTRPDGSFLLELPQALAEFPYYHLVEIDPAGLTSVAALAGSGGVVMDPNWIAIGPTSGGQFTGFAFWDDEPSATPTPLPAAAVLITEVEYDSIEPGTDSAWEWVELRNNSDSLLRLSGWSLTDNLGTDLLPTLVLTPGAFLILAASPTDFLAHYPAVTAPIIAIADGQIGNGLGNTGDLLRLSDGAGRLVDALSWGDNTAVFDPSAPDVVPGHSLARRDPAVDTDRAADWFDEASPSPGRGPVFVTPTPTNTPEGTPTSTPTPATPLTVVINEIAWGGTLASASDEWMELFNPGPAAVDLAGWTLSDGGDVTITLSGALAPGAFYLLERSDDTTVNDTPADLIYEGTLSNNGEALTLRDARGHVVDTANGDGGAWPAGSGYPDYVTLERLDAALPDSDANWATNNGLVRNGLDADGNAIQGTPRQPNSVTLPTPTATPTEAVTPTATPTPDPAWAAVRLNEFLPAPEAVDWNGDGVLDEDDEYVELFNNGSTALDLGGFQFDDLANGGSTPYSFAAGTLLPAHGFLVLFRSQSGVALNNTGGDDVRLLAPDGRELQAVHYASAHDDHAWSALPDGSDAWSGDAAPSPGRSNCAETGCGTPTPTPTATVSVTPTPDPAWAAVRLNEFLPAPESVDWNGDGVLDEDDEYVELFNNGSTAL
ncbi:MAG: lamin tail domain-containing protein, partial [Anaerolineae bacterium]